MKKIFIGIAGHKKYKMPTDYPYIPIQVGAKGKPTIKGFLRDDIGDNISDLNSNFSELTGLYYIWKNIDSEYKGLVHYRRYFKRSYLKTILKPSEDFNRILKKKDFEKIFSKSNVILPKKRKYYIETNYSHYVNAHSAEALIYSKKIIEENYPEYLVSFEHVMKSRSAHMFNMFIMKSEFFDEYCSWLFSILFKLQEKIDLSKYPGQEARVFGYVSELLLDVWIEKKQISFKEIPVFYVEGQHLLKKGMGLIVRKMVGHGDSHIKSRVD